ncbi:DUF6193 family natural product biosynthesis protein [Kitasatospora sp. NPDC059571]|uniref:DUF6193 family natural product biosynthesis protein n=1 Tax=Kitasatospora sp. NPDC059571 TaxID=3346871 RepID=UPI0036A676C9
MAAAAGLDLPVPYEERERRAEFRTADGRRAIVIAPRDERGHWVRLYAQGAWLAQGTTGDPAAAVGAVAAWTDGADLERTRAAAPFIRFGSRALAHEREPLGPVELAWCHTIDSFRLPPTSRHPRALALLEAAYAQPALRGLRPVTSHFTLWFSSSIDFPYTRVGCAVDPHHGGQYAVRSRGGEIVARTDTPEEAVAVVVAALPPGTGPAR